MLFSWNVWLIWTTDTVGTNRTDGCDFNIATSLPLTQIEIHDVTVGTLAQRGTFAICACQGIIFAQTETNSITSNCDLGKECLVEIYLLLSVICKLSHRMYFNTMNLSTRNISWCVSYYQEINPVQQMSLAERGKKQIQEMLNMLRYVFFLVIVTKTEIWRRKMVIQDGTWSICNTHNRLVKYETQTNIRNILLAANLPATLWKERSSW